MSTDSSPFISIDYDGKDFPTAYEKQQLGNYEPDLVFLDELDNESSEYGVTVLSEDLNEFFSELLKPKGLVFRYANQDALEERKRNPIEEEAEAYQRTPPFTFDFEEVELDPNLAWMDMLDDLHDTVGLFGVQRIDFKSPRKPMQSTAELESYLQKSGVYVVSNIQGIGDLRYDWLKDEVEIKKYSDEIVFQDDEFSPEDERRELMRDPREDNWRTVKYDVDHEQLQRLTEELERNFRNVNVNTFDQNVIPPEIRDDING